VTETVESAVKSLAAAGKCVLFSTHLLGQAEDICHRIGVIGGGRVLGEGTIPELCEATGAKNLRQAFFTMVDRASIDVELAPLKAFPVVTPASAPPVEATPASRSTRSVETSSQTLPLRGNRDAGVATTKEPPGGGGA
jgi:ABC-type multidrug transport system ATPase subunit